ncbi:MAG: PEP-CTERM sorting domain-containing protein [Burkholderiales bacterium]|nr:PEP-CTERM sorting domain-containing protein [Burkholderiales bacterium]
MAGALLGVSTGANANLVQNGELFIGAQGFGNAPRLLTIQGNGTESGAIGIVGGNLVALTPGIANASVFGGNGVTNPGGDTVSPLSDNQKFGIPTLGELNWTSGANVNLLFNATEPGGDGLTVTDVTLKFYNGNTVIAAIDGSFSLLSTQTGNGSAGFLINVDAAQQTFLNTTVFSQAGASAFRIALESTITGVAGGPESFSAVSAVTAVPEPETYAMMLAGLGLMGMVGVRRKKS